MTIKIKLGKSVTTGTCACGAQSICLVDDDSPVSKPAWVEFCDKGHLYVCVDAPVEVEAGEGGESTPSQLVFDFAKVS